MARKTRELTDAQWHILEPMLRLPTKPMAKGRQRRDLRLMAEAAFFILRTGAPWRDLPIKYGPWQTAYHYFNRWSHAGQLAQAHLQLVALLHEVSLVHPGTMHIDATHCRASKAAAGACHTSKKQAA